MAPARPRFAAPTIQPESSGVSLTRGDACDLVAPGLAVDFFAVHAESNIGNGGPLPRWLERIRAEYPIALHSTGLSIGAHHPPDRDHIARLRQLIDRHDPSFFSVPLAWSTHEGTYLSAELPLPYNSESLTLVCRNVDQVQRGLGMRVLLENPASYLFLDETIMREGAFLHAVVEQTGCGLVLDIANVFVSAINLDCEPMGLVDSFPIDDVELLHLAGFSENTDDNGARLLIVDHQVRVPESIWAIYRRILGRTGPLPTVIERQQGSSFGLADDAAIAKQALRRAARQSMNRNQRQLGTAP
ncbi:MAG: DUF692 domain-containing protein [Xanthobacteraceae bacterium]|nr:DUF692 domain-containing protein [Xanthobacteraceae bacterium]